MPLIPYNHQAIDVKMGHLLLNLPKYMTCSLRKSINRARRINTFGSVVVLLFITGGIWMYQFSGLDIPIVINIVLSISLGVLAFTAPMKLDELCVAKCPKRKTVVEKGGVLGQETPSVCPKCGLSMESCACE